MTIDKEASSRFIKHAINQAQAQAPTAGPSHIRFNETTERVVVKVTDKMREREQYEKELKEASAEDSDDGELEVFEEEVPRSGLNGKGEGKAPQGSESPLPDSGKKRRRPAADIFVG